MTYKLSKTGYLHPNYAFSFSEYGKPIQLTYSGGWIIERRVPGSKERDAMGCYPIFCCTDWLRLSKDLDAIRSNLISLVTVIDPFSGVTEDYLIDLFKDMVVPFKNHYIADLKLPIEKIVGRKHRKNGRRALKKINIDVCQNPEIYLDDWMQLYQFLIKRHSIHDIRKFSKKSFYLQLRIPNTFIILAKYNNEIIAAQIYFCQGEVVYCHLGASKPIGYELGAFHALDYFSIQYFADKARWLDFGGGTGALDEKDGLSMYKKGWSTHTRTAYLCGKIYNKKKYNELIDSKLNGKHKNYFPAYRQGEFGIE